MVPLKDAHHTIDRTLVELADKLEARSAQDLVTQCRLLIAYASRGLSRIVGHADAARLLEAYAASHREKAKMAALLSNLNPTSLLEAYAAAHREEAKMAALSNLNPTSDQETQ